MKAKLEKVSTNVNPVVDTLLYLQGDDEVSFRDLPTKGDIFTFDTKHDVIFTTPVKDFEWAMDEKSLTFWTKNTEYKLTFAEKATKGPVEHS